MLTLYYSPASASLAVHIALRELDIAHTLALTSTGAEAHKEPGYLALNPVGRVPTLVLEDGTALTEVIAILNYLSSLSPKSGLIPAEPLARARCHELLSVIATGMQPVYRMIVRPDRVVPEAEDTAPIVAAGRARFLEMMGLVEGHFWRGPWAIGESYSAADIYLFVMFAWVGVLGVDLAQWPKLRGWARRMRQRPAVLEALLAEGLIDESGRPMPPSRV